MVRITWGNRCAKLSSLPPPLPPTIALPRNPMMKVNLLRPLPLLLLITATMTISIPKSPNPRMKRRSHPSTRPPFISSTKKTIVQWSCCMSVLGVLV